MECVFFFFLSLEVKVHSKVLAANGKRTRSFPWAHRLFIILVYRLKKTRGKREKRGKRLLFSSQETKKYVKKKNLRKKKRCMSWFTFLFWSLIRRKKENIDLGITTTSPGDEREKRVHKFWRGNRAKKNECICVRRKLNMKWIWRDVTGYSHNRFVFFLSFFSKKNQDTKFLQRIVTFKKRLECRKNRIFKYVVSRMEIS